MLHGPSALELFVKNSDVNLDLPYMIHFRTSIVFTVRVESHMFVFMKMQMAAYTLLA